MDVQQRAAARRQGGLPEVDVSTVDAFLADVDSAGAVAVLLSAGDPARFPEALDVAIVLPELITAFQGRLRGASPSGWKRSSPPCSTGGRSAASVSASTLPN